MKTNFDDLIRKNIKDIDSVNNISNNFTESVISRILVQSRVKTNEPLISKSTFVIIGILLSIVFGFTIISQGSNASQFSGNFSNLALTYNNLLNSFVNFSKDFSFLYFIAAFFLLIDLVARKIINRDKFLHF
jgi:hypothetical protein